MALRKLKIVIWCGAGANQKALANKMSAEFDVAGIVIDMHSGNKARKLYFQLPSVLWDHFRFRKIYAAWSNLMKHYDQQFPGWPDIPCLKVTEINDLQTKVFTEQLQPDLIIVSGTALIKKKMLDMETSVGIINLHTGLSPYVKGGPNCSNWCIANNTFHLVGNTIMWLNEGIDSGNIITTETVNILNAADLNEAHRVVMDHAHDLYIRSVRYLSNAVPPYNSVPQSSIDKGRLYLTKMWKARQKKQLLKNWKMREHFVAPASPKTISLISQ
ncbi:MAG TPA: formyltransferase family protein [Chitinophagaceae bacterium]|nr:formyltransferase family protein [Chitinophagaceae bacterium]